MRLCQGLLLLFCSAWGAAMAGQALPAHAVLVASEPSPDGLFREAGTQQLHGELLPETPIPEADAMAASSSSEQLVSAPAQAAGAWQPITAQQRLMLFWNDTYNSPGAFVALSIGAMIGQVTDTPAAWDDGNGYTRRFASSYGQLAIRNVIHEGLDGAVGLDPRYSRCSCKGAFRRSTHALKMSFTAYTRDGRTTVDTPEIAGAYGSGMISTYWYPHHSYSPLVQGVQFGHEEMGEVVIGNMFQEFAHDLKQALHLRSSSSSLK